jgi:hypothetical protein
MSDSETKKSPSLITVASDDNGVADGTDVGTLLAATSMVTRTFSCSPQQVLLPLLAGIGSRFVI